MGRPREILTFVRDSALGSSKIKVLSSDQKFWDSPARGQNRQCASRVEKRYGQRQGRAQTVDKPLEYLPIHISSKISRLTSRRSPYKPEINISPGIY
jgi:hypothetical protein